MGVTVLGIQHNFYPRSPCGERLLGNVVAGLRMLFLSTLSLRRATKGKSQADTTGTISIHALLAESDLFSCFWCIYICIFLSTLSLRRATAADISTRREANISIHALLAESDIGPLILSVQPRNFYPRSPCGERRILPHHG